MAWRVVPPRTVLLRNRGTPAAGGSQPSSLEAWARKLAVLFACLYVLGLVAINLHLLSLGIADFTLLQARCIATGALCLAYLAMLLVISAGLAWLASAALSATTLRWLVGGLLGSVLMGFLAFLVAAGALAQLTPYAVDPPVIDLRSVRERWADLLLLLSMARLFFLNRETFALVVLLMSGFWLLRLVKLEQPALLTSRRLRWLVGLLDKLRLDQQAAAYLLVTAGALIALALVLRPFARNVYPNVLVSYGGGQPQVVEIQPHAVSTAPERAYAGIRLISVPNQPVVTEQVVLWHESDKFLYVAPLRVAPARPEVVAIDLRSVRSMRHVDVPLRVGSEGRVLVIHP